ncbi:MAG: hypothetical protein V4482_06180 [Pseudomonadota bacterium]
MFRKILSFVMTNISTTIYFSASILASDYFQTGLAWSNEDQLAAMHDRIHTTIRERYEQNQQSSLVKRKNLNIEINSVCELADSYTPYLNYMTLCESKENVHIIDRYSQSFYYDFLHKITDIFFATLPVSHIYCHMEIKRALHYGKKEDSTLRSLAITDFKETLQKVVLMRKAVLSISPDDKDSVYWYANQITKNHRKNLNLPNFSYLARRISEIPKEHRHSIFKESSFFPQLRNCAKITYITLCDIV